MMERGGRARIKHVKSSGVRVLIPEIQKNIGKTATIYTDEHGSYRLLKRRGYKHETINHSQQEYVVGRDSYEEVSFATTRLDYLLDAEYKGKIWFPIDEERDDPDEPVEPTVLTKLPQVDD